MSEERHDKTIAALRETARRAPPAPGVYRWLDDDGGVLYVGKAKDLRKRLASYFRGGAAAPGGHIAEMVSRAGTIEYVVTASETEALLLEDNFIKEARPPFNLRLRDDKSYPFIEITLIDEWPRVRFFRGRHVPGNLYFGPFSNARKVRETLELIGRIFPYRKCKAERPGRPSGSPCLQYFIDRSLGPCDDRVSRDDYLAQIAHFQRFLEGKRQRVLRALDEEMRRASQALEYERAARLRDQIHALESLAKRGETDFFPEATAPPTVNPKEGMEELQELLKLPHPPRTIDGVDVSNLSGEDAVGSVVTFVDGRPFKSGYRRFRIRSVILVGLHVRLHKLRCHQLHRMPKRL